MLGEIKVNGAAVLPILPNGSKPQTSTMAVKKTNTLPEWLTVNTIISILTLIGIVGGFYANFAVQSERITTMNVAFADHTKKAEEQLKFLETQLQIINTKLAYLQGKDDRDRELKTKK